VRRAIKALSQAAAPMLPGGGSSGKARSN
jgi:hypothetical protein